MVQCVVLATRPRPKVTPLLRSPTKLSTCVIGPILDLGLEERVDMLAMASPMLPLLIIVVILKLLLPCPVHLPLVRRRPVVSLVGPLSIRAVIDPDGTRPAVTLLATETTLVLAFRFPCIGKPFTIALQFPLVTIIGQLLLSVRPQPGAGPCLKQQGTVLLAALLAALISSPKPCVSGSPLLPTIPTVHSAMMTLPPLLLALWLHT